MMIYTCNDEVYYNCSYTVMPCYNQCFWQQFGRI